jgi:plasmid stabilization system protein ParE
MTYRVIVEPTADRGIRETYRWIAENRSPSAAAKIKRGQEPLFGFH